MLKQVFAYISNSPPEFNDKATSMQQTQGVFNASCLIEMIFTLTLINKPISPKLPHNK